MTTTTSTWLTSEQAATRAGITLNTLYGWLRRGTVRARRDTVKGRPIYSIDPVSLDAMLTRRSTLAQRIAAAGEELEFFCSIGMTEEAAIRRIASVYSVSESTVHRWLTQGATP